MIYHHLFSKAANGAGMSAGIIGAGHYGTAVVTQSIRNPYLRIPIIADRNIENAKLAFRRAGIREESIRECSSVTEALLAIEKGDAVVTADPMILMELPLEVIVESTGIPEAGARYAAEAIRHGKHVAMVNKETDSVVGPVLRHLADRAGLVYTPVDGDQHGLLMGLVEWARSIGLEVISAGKARDAEYVVDREAGTVTCYADHITVHETTTVRVTIAEAALLDSMPDGGNAGRLARRQELLSALPLPGAFDLCELTIAANAIGFRPDVPETHAPIVHTAEIPRVLCLQEDGGVLGRSGSIDMVTCLRHGFEAGLGGGVFIVVSCENDYSRMIVTTKGCISNASGTAALIYRPYHLCGVETSTSIICAGLLGLNTGTAEFRQINDTVKAAARDLRAGEILGDDHDRSLRASIVPATCRANDAPVPAHMLTGNRLRRDVPAGTVITYDMVEEPANSVLWRLRVQQEELSVREPSAVG